MAELSLMNDEAQRHHDASTMLVLPADRPRSAQAGYCSASHRVALDADTVAGLGTLAAGHGCTSFMAMYAVFNVLLARYSGQYDISAGTPGEGAPRLLSTRLDERMSFAAAMAEARAALQGAFAVSAAASRFQVLFAMDGERARTAASAVEARLDLALHIGRDQTGVHAEFFYNGALFDAATIERMALHFQTLLAAAASAPATQIGELALLRAVDLEQMLSGLNPAPTVYPSGETIHALIERQAARDPEAVAVVFEDAQLTYAELNARANMLAHHLRSLGVGPDSLVGVCVERSLDMIVSLLGILKAGGAYLPLDPGYPAERLAYMLEDAAPAVLLTQQHLAGRLPAIGGATFCIDSGWSEVAACGVHNPRACVLPEHLAYVIYTSGSTGKPKGAMLRHRGLCNLVSAQIIAARVTPGQRMLQFASFNFDASTWEIFITLASGATLCMAAREAVMPGSLEGTLQRLRITMALLPPVVLNTLTHVALPDLQTIVSGGEACSAALANAWTSKAAFYNAYGPTEATVYATVAHIGGALAAVAPIGAPIANTQVYILDARLNPVPVGVTGELHIAGDGLARGYLNRPELTAATFVPNPFGAPGSRMYRSGDLARYLADGSIEYLGRADTQVKIRGFRIELGEIEAALAQQAGVREALVLAREDAPGDKRLAAYLIMEEGAAPMDGAALRSALLATLPDYMVPAHFIALAAFPLTPNGKVDRRALPAPDGARSDDGYVAPRTPTEEILDGVWAGLLGLDRVGVHDNFFALGGHSLMATQVVSQVRKDCEVELAPGALFEAPTIAQLAQAVDTLRQQQSGGAPQALQSVPRPALLPLSLAQQGLWFLDQLDTGRARYNVPLALRLEGALDADALRRALNEIVRRHETLRASFRQQDGTPVQLIAPVLEIALPLTDLAGLPHAEQESRFKWLMQDEAQAPFDLATGPLLRAGLLRLQPQEHVLLLTMHHIVSDGWSVGVLMHELGALYQAYTHGQPSPLPPLPVQYADFAHWQRQWLDGAVFAQQLDYWRGHLAGAPTLLTLPTDRPRPALQGYCGATHHFTLSASAAGRLYALGRSHNCTLFMTLLAAFNVLLARYSGQQDICVGSPIANRNRSETEGLIGFFVNTLALRSQVDEHMSFAELLAQVRRTALGAYAHQDVPFEQLLDALKPERHLSHTPLFQVVLVLQNARMSDLDTAGLCSTSVHVHNGTTKYDIVLSVTERSGALDCHIEYSTDLFEHATIARMAGHYVHLLESAAASPEARLCDLGMLGAAERRQLLVDWNAPALPVRPVQADTLHALFERQAAQHPDACALVYGAEQLSYRELNERANRLARHLRAMGVGPDILVGLWLERSAAMIVALLATLKAGGAYVPLDPAYPAERVAYMLSDSRPAVLLTQSSLDGQLPPLAQPVLCLDQIDAIVQGYSGENLAPSAGAANLAYVIYTSGSTGQPKGALLQHSNVLRLFSATAGWFDFDERDTWTMFHSYAFDFSVWEIWGALLHGGKLVVVPYLVSRSPEQFHALLVREQVTVLNQTPSAFQQLVEYDLGHPGTEPLSLRSVIFGGEALNQAALAPWFARHGDTRPQLINMYGITETTVHVTYQALTGTPSDRSSIGRPIPDLATYILDAQFNPVPAGVAGELFVAGPGLARGYLNRPDLSADRFVPNPFGAPGSRMYKSGDLARYLPDGRMEYMGRIDSQVKIRGFRIELGEIEAALAQQPGVLEATVLVREDRPGDKRLVAYLVPHDDAAVGAPALREALLQTLPEYMVPVHFVIMDQLPLTQNGKVDRRALPAPEAGHSGQQYTAPRNEEERMLAAIWADVLHLERVGIHDNYFAIGGDSIRSIAILARARDAGMHITLEQLFMHQTVAAVLAHRSAGAAEQGAVQPQASVLSDEDRALLPDGVEDAYRLSRLQMAMVFHNQLTEELGTYHDIETLRLSLARWEPAALRGALDAMARRHPVLRTSFDLTRYSEPLQLVRRQASIPLEIIDIGGLPAKAQERAITDWCAAERLRAFDLEAAPLVTVCIHLLGENTVQYTFSCHHAILDGWSVASFHTELFGHYHALLQDSGAALDERAPAASVKAMIAREQQAIDDQHCKDFWRAYLDGHVLTRLPVEAALKEVAVNEVLTVPVPAGVQQRLAELAHGMQLPVKTLYFTAYLRALAVACGTRDLMTGLVSHCRPADEDGNEVLGLFLNTLPFRLRLSECSWSELAAGVFQQELELMEHRHYPYTQLYLDNEREELFDSAFNYINFHVFDSLSGNGSVRILEKATQDSTEFALMTHVINEAGEVKLMLDYDRRRLSPERVADFAQCLQTVLASIAHAPAASHQAQDFLRTDVRQDLLVNWNDTAVARAADQTIHGRFEAHAAAAPDACAIVAGEERISYRQLNERSNRLARYLRDAGVGPDVAVGICAERSPALVVAVLAVLKAGGAYVALDPAYPAERIAFMLGDVQPALVLTQEHLVAQLEGSGQALFCLDRDGARLDAFDCGNLAPAAPPEALAYVLYTSGSTGKPKGVGLPVGALCNLLEWQHATHPGVQVGGTLQFASLNFDVSFQEIFSTLRGGGTLVLIDSELHHDLERLCEMVAAADVARLFLPNAVLQQMAELYPEGARKALPCEVYSAGEQLVLTPALAALLDRLGHASLYNQYGPSETHVVAEYDLTRPSPFAQPARPPIGRPVANTQLYILDENYHPVPLGVGGQLFIAGANLARGYLNRAAATAESFVPNPFGAPGSRMYRTGDLARYLPDGNIEYLGRIDYQVKIRGFRIELGEIEAALLALPQLRDAVVLAREDAPGDKRLVAYVVAHDGVQLDAHLLRAALAQAMPEHMVPAHIVPMDELPLTTNGKVDRRALPAPSAAADERDFLAPETDTEIALAAIWSEALGVARVGRDDSFLGLGGHSLLATRVISKMRRSFGIDLSLRLLLEAADLRSLAQQIASAQWLAAQASSTDVEQWEEI